MAHATTGVHAARRARLHEAEKALKAARARNQRARAALLVATGAGAAARRMVVELSDREVRRAAADLAAAAEALAALDPDQFPLLAAGRAGPCRITAGRAEAARTVQAARPPPGADAVAGPLFAWAKAHHAAA